MLSWFRKQAPIEVQEAAQTGIELVAESPLEHEHESEKREDETELEDGDDEDYDDEEDEDYEEEDEREQIAERIFAWGEEWSKTPGFEALTQEQKDESEFIVGTFTDYMYTYHDCPPEEWDTESMQSCCLNTLPCKISAEEVYFRSVAPVLASFFTFLGTTRRLRNSSRMAARILQLGPRIVAASKDSRNWGFAKAFAMSAMEAGVDLNDETAMNAFTARYNEQIVGQPLPMAGASLPDYIPEPDELDWDEVDRMPYEREGPKIGRNDPCPCGSGKKYKKCCGSS